MANNLLTISMITREAIPLFLNTNAFIKSLDRQYDSEFGKKGEKIGSQLRVRLPNDFTVRHGPGISVQDTSEVQTTLTMSHQDGVDVSFSSADLLLSLDDFSDRILLPMMNDLAGDIASQIMQAGEGGICNLQANTTGGSDLSGNLLNPNAGTYLAARASLNDNSAPMPNRKIVNDPWSESRVVQSLTGLLNPTAAISDQYYEGTMYRALGALWYMDQTVIKHTNGTFSAGGTVAGAGQTGTTLTVNAITGTFAQGDIITIAGVNAVNRVTKDSTGMLRQFVVTANVINGATSIPIYPSIIPAVGGNKVQYQTVDASPANAAAVTLILGPSTVFRKNFYYSPNMVTMATGDLPLPANKETSRARYDSISMRSITDYIIGTDQEVTRFDVLWGVLYVRPEWGTIVADRI